MVFLKRCKQNYFLIHCIRNVILQTVELQKLMQITHCNLLIADLSPGHRKDWSQILQWVRGRAGTSAQVLWFISLHSHLESGIINETDLTTLKLPEIKWMLRLATISGGQRKVSFWLLYKVTWVIPFLLSEKVLFFLFPTLLAFQGQE